MNTLELLTVQFLAFHLLVVPGGYVYMYMLLEYAVRNLADPARSAA